MVDVIDVQYRLVDVMRQKYVCRCGGCVETAPGPERVLSGGRFSLLFGCKVFHDKYGLHLPLDRQRRHLAGLGLEVTTSTLLEAAPRPRA